MVWYAWILLLALYYLLGVGMRVRMLVGIVRDNGLDIGLERFDDVVRASADWATLFWPTGLKKDRWATQEYLALGSRLRGLGNPERLIPKLQNAVQMRDRSGNVTYIADVEGKLSVLQQFPDRRSRVLGLSWGVARIAELAPTGVVDVGTWWLENHNQLSLLRLPSELVLIPHLDARGNVYYEEIQEDGYLDAVQEWRKRRFVRAESGD